MRISDWSSDVCSSDLLRCSSTATIIRGRSNLNRRSAVVATAAHHPPRRKQRAITIRSDHALKRLELLARDGRSQVEIIEEALDRMPLPKEKDRDAFLAEIRAIQARVPKRTYPTMAEIDAELWDEDEIGRAHV